VALIVTAVVGLIAYGVGVGGVGALLIGLVLGIVGLVALELSPRLRRRVRGAPVGGIPPPPVPPAAAVPIVAPEFVPFHVTPEYLIGLFSDRTTIQGQTLLQPSVGKKMRVSVRVADIARVDAEVLIRITGHTAADTPVQMYFEKPHSDQIIGLKAPDQITVVGTITANTGPYSVTLDPCWLEKVG